MGLFLGNHLVSPAQIINEGDNSIDCLRIIDNNNNVTTPTTATTFSTPSNAKNIISNYTFYHMFYDNNNIISVDCSSVETVSGVSAFQEFMYQYEYRNTSVTSVDFSNLTTVSGSSAFNSAFERCRFLTSVDFSNLTTVSGDYAFDSTFRETSFSTIDLSKLTTVSGESAFSRCFCNNYALTTISFPKLEYVSEDCFQESFSGCFNLKSIYFGGLKESTMGNATHPFGSGGYNYIFYNCDALTEIHFRADARSKIQSLTGFADKWGASNATIYFDLGAEWLRLLSMDGIHVAKSVFLPAGDDGSKWHEVSIEEAMKIKKANKKNTN